MIRAFLIVILLSAAAVAGLPAGAADQRVVAARSLAAGTLLVPADLRLGSGDALPDVMLPEFEGLATRRAIYAGQPVSASDLGPPMVVRRNDLVTMRFTSGRLEIIAEGRALAEGGVGDRIRVLNLESRIPVTARIAGAAIVEVR